MAEITITQIHTLLTEVANRYPHPATLTLLGGSALSLLGSTRPTLDIDYVGHDLHKNELQHTIDSVAQEMQIEVEAVSIDGFIPLPTDSLMRQLPHAKEFSLNPTNMKEHLIDVRRQLLTYRDDT